MNVPVYTVFFNERKGDMTESSFGKGMITREKEKGKMERAEFLGWGSCFDT